MTLLGLDPFWNAEELQNRINRMFEDPYSGVLDIEIAKPEAKPLKQITVKVE
ncbi:MAG: hypothetical protein PVF37_12570 [Desulfobacterales bacterium]